MNCKECGCQTGGGEFCYQHAPYMVYPQKDGSFIVDRNGRRRVWLDEPPSAECPSCGRELSDVCWTCAEHGPPRKTPTVQAIRPIGVAVEARPRPVKDHEKAQG